MRVARVVIAAVVIASLAPAVILAGPFGPRDAKGPGGGKGECIGAPDKGRPSRHPMPEPEQLAKAGATEEQINALMQFDRGQQLKRIDLKASVEKAELELNHLKKSDSVDEKAVLKAVDALNQARGELLKLDVVSELQMKKILGDEVFLKIREQRPPAGMDAADMSAVSGIEICRRWMKTTILCSSNELETMQAG